MNIIDNKAPSIIISITDENACIRFDEYISQKFPHIREDDKAIIKKCLNELDSKSKEEVIRNFCKAADELFLSAPKDCEKLSPVIIFNGLLPYIKKEKNLDECVKGIQSKIIKLKHCSKLMGKVITKHLVKKLTLDKEVQKLSGSDFSLWISNAASIIEPKLVHKENEKLVIDLLHERQIEKDFEMLAFKTIGSIVPGREVVIPEIELKPLSKLKSSQYTYDQGFYYSEDAYRQHSALKLNPPNNQLNEEQLGKILDNISKIKNVPWGYKDGCYLKADLILQVLRLMGVSAQHLSKKYFLTPSGHKWDYHVAACVRIDSKEWILDPYFFAEKNEPFRALSESEWLSYLDSSKVKPVVEKAEFKKHYFRSPLPRLFATTTNFSTYTRDGQFHEITNHVHITQIIYRHLFQERLEVERSLSVKAPKLYSLITSEDWDDNFNKQIELVKELDTASKDSRALFPRIANLRRINLDFISTFISSASWSELYSKLASLKLKCVLIIYETMLINDPKKSAKLKSLQEILKMLDRKILIIPSIFRKHDVIDPQLKFLDWATSHSLKVPSLDLIEEVRYFDFVQYFERGWNTMKDLIEMALAKMDKPGKCRYHLSKRILSTIRAKIEESNLKLKREIK